MLSAINRKYVLTAFVIIVTFICHNKLFPSQLSKFIVKIAKSNCTKLLFKVFKLSIVFTNSWSFKVKYLSSCHPSSMTCIIDSSQTHMY